MFLFPGVFFVIWMAFVFGLVLIPAAFTIASLVEIVRAPDAAFGPPWDNGKNAWTLGLALAFVIPFGTIVGPILWFSSGRRALHAGQQVPRPFWSPRPAYPPQGYPPAYPPHPGYPGQQQPPADQPPAAQPPVS